MTSPSTAKVTGTTCGCPSGEMVASLATRAVSSRSLASSGAIRMASASDQPGFERVLTEAAVRSRLHPPGPFSGHDGDCLGQIGTDVVQADAVLAGIPGRKRVPGNEPTVNVPARLAVEIVM